MKKLSYLIIITISLLIFACSKNEKSEKFKLLTTPTWTTDSLLANKVDASGPGGLLEKFKGDAKFKEDGTGTFGLYKGLWTFNPPETQITIVPDTPKITIVCNIIELTNISFKIATVLLDKNTLQPVNIRMTFIAK